MKRPQLDDAVIDQTLANIRDSYHLALARKGKGIWLSYQEMLGKLTEEYHEVIEAVHAADDGAVRAEVIDVAVVCLHWLASRRQQAKNAAVAERRKHSATASEILSCITTDLRGRSGLGDVWDEMDDDTKVELIDTWLTCIDSVLK